MAQQIRTPMVCAAIVTTQYGKTELLAAPLDVLREQLESRADRGTMTFKLYEVASYN